MRKMNCSMGGSDMHKCKTCVYFEGPDEFGYGTCRRYPPIAFIDSEIGITGNNQSLQPDVHGEHDYCFEHPDMKIFERKDRYDKR